MRPPYRIPTRWYRTAGIWVSGCWYPRKKPGDQIQKGELLGEIRNIFSEPLCRIHAETDGVVLYQTASLGIEAGAPMIAYGELEKEV